MTSDNALAIMHPTRSRLVRAFYRVLAAFPFALACLLGLRVVFGMVDRQHYMLPHLAMRLPALAAVLAGALLVAVLCRAMARLGSRRLAAIAAPAAIALLALGVRVAFVAAYGHRLEPFSDFLWAYEAATGADPHVFRYQLYPTWGFYAWAMEAFFGVAPASFVSVQYANAAMQALSAAALYALAMLAVGDRAVAAAASAAYALSPTAVAYCMLLSPEIPAILLFLAALALAMLGLVRARRAPLAVACVAASGAVLGLAGWFKPVAPVVVVAFAVTLAFCWPLASRPPARAASRGKGAGAMGAASRAAVPVLLAVALAAGYAAVHASLEKAVEGRLGAPVASSTLPLFMYPGLHHDGEGQVHLGERRGLHLEAYEAYAPDFDEAGRVVARALAEDLSENADAIPGLVAHKLLWAWQGDVQVFGYAEERVGPSGALGFLSSLAQWYYIVLMAAAAAGALALAGSPKDARGMFLPAAVVFGFFLLLLVSEAQSRYKIVVMPLVTLVAAYGFRNVGSAAIDYARGRAGGRAERGGEQAITSMCYWRG